MSKRRRFKEPRPVHKPTPTHYGLDDAVRFGKWKGRTVREAVDAEPGYFAWALRENLVEFDDEAFRYYQRANTDHQINLFSPSPEVPETAKRTPLQELEDDPL